MTEIPDAQPARRVARSAPPSLAPLGPRAAAGNVAEKGRARVAPPRNATPLRLDGATVTVPALKEHVAGLLKAEAR